MEVNVEVFGKPVKMRSGSACESSVYSKSSDFEKDFILLKKETVYLCMVARANPQNRQFLNFLICRPAGSFRENISHDLDGVLL